MSTKTRVTVVITQILVYDLEGNVADAQAIQIAKARTLEKHPLDLQEETMNIMSTRVEHLK